MTTSDVRRFLKVRVRDAQEQPDLIGLCADYEEGAWRSRTFARYLAQHLVTFILPIEEWGEVGPETWLPYAAKAARSFYNTQKIDTRGEVGELLLFSILRDYYNTIPIISKLYFKSAANDTVKGFDAVHFVNSQKGMEIWLGEVKLYEDAASAIRDVAKELCLHFKSNYLRREFMWIEHKLSPKGEHSKSIIDLLSDRRSLDEIIKQIHVPVLIAYNSKAVASHVQDCDAYRKDFESEVKKYYNSFCNQDIPTNITLHVIFVPLGSKASLVQEFDERLKALEIAGA